MKKRSKKYCEALKKVEKGKAVMIDQFNNFFNRGANKYEGLLQKFVTKKMFTLPILLIFCLGTFFLSNKVPSGFIPGEDQGMIYAIVQTPPGSTLERTHKIALDLQKKTEKIGKNIGKAKIQI